jgi:hypothetical protein
MARDKVKHAIAKRNHFLANREKYYTASNQAKRKKVKILQDYKSDRGCANCPEKRGPCLEFHHPNDDKVMTIAKMVSRYSIERIMVEVRKCIVICRNCHAMEHWTKFGN